jgi:hypothetical protein
MTCIAAFVEGDTVWVGGDSAGVAGYDLLVRADQKVFRNGQMLFGFTDSFRMGQLLRYALNVPHHHADVDIQKYMVTTFMDAVRECLKTHGFARKREDAEIGGGFIVGYRNQLFRIDNDYQVGLSVGGYMAMGCGDQIAHGALFASAGVETGEKRMGVVLAAAERHSAGVRGPFHIESLKSESAVSR